MLTGTEKTRSTCSLPSYHADACARAHTNARAHRDACARTPTNARASTQAYACARRQTRPYTPRMDRRKVAANTTPMDIKCGYGSVLQDRNQKVLVGKSKCCFPKDTLNSCNLLPQEALRIEGSRCISFKNRYQTSSPQEVAEK